MRPPPTIQELNGYTKYCRYCETEKPVCEFYKWSSYCKSCVRLYDFERKNKLQDTSELLVKASVRRAEINRSRLPCRACGRYHQYMEKRHAR